ncbi:PREDICTED: putative pentatricopeptide repeat-containing protein At1g17630 [Camelina sativa]|uniref:Pentatricopeptide repeat-containing protein At1g17630 n=1 Tax=Camelina sativa TaxID=90675 RepID=A0ABM0VPS3_CAMSA|nr:PREDICTED: putative pentatricopeptide repeat-containing protein At1g17630 [Camelina sativa]
MVHSSLWRFRLQQIPWRLRNSCFHTSPCRPYTPISSPDVVSVSSYYYSLTINNDQSLFDHVLRLCLTAQQCKQVHAQVLVSDFIYRSGSLAANFISVYSWLGLLVDARNVFETVSLVLCSDLRLCYSILKANVSHGLHVTALELYDGMRERGLAGDAYVLPLILRACRYLCRFGFCQAFHSHVIQIGLKENLHVVNELLVLYANNAGSVGDAYKLFVEMPVRNRMSWNVMIKGFSQEYDCESAVKIFEWMQREECIPDEVTWTSVLSCHSQCGKFEDVIKYFHVMRMSGSVVSGEALAVFFSVCAELGALSTAEKVHGFVIKGGFEEYLPSKNALTHVYGKQGRVKEAEHLFRQIRNKGIESWNSLITSFVDAGKLDEALSLFTELEEMNDVCHVKANVVTWTSVIKGCNVQGRGDDSLEYFRRMQFSKVLANSVTICCILSICAELPAMNLGREIHGHVIRTSMSGNILVQNALVNMYTKCGLLNEGSLVFEAIWDKDLISWNSIIKGYGMHGFGERALSMFDRMIRSGCHPDGITLVAVLSACSHAGLVEKGRGIFYSMSKKFGLEPQQEHYACIVDLLGRVGFVKEASEIVQNMPMEPKVCVLGALLNSCRMHKYMDTAEDIASQISVLEPERTGSYMLLSNIYSAGGKWEESAKVRALAKKKDLKKVSGSSWIELKNKIYKFSSGSIVQSEFASVYLVLEDLVSHMLKKGPTHDGNNYEDDQLWTA